MFRHSKSRLLPGSHTTLILTVGVIVFYLSVSTFMIASLNLFVSEADLQETINFWKHYQRVQ